MKIKMALMVIFVLFSIPARATNFKNPRSIGPSSYKLVNFPEIGVESDAENGESIIYSANKIGSKTITLQHDILVINKILWASYKYVIFKGVGLAKAEVDAGVFYQFDGSEHSESGNVYKGSKVSLFVPYNKSDDFELCENDSDYFKVYVCAKVGRLVENLDFTKGENFAFSEQSLKQELVYTGVAKGVITLLYREFKDNMARPSFNQELKYDIAQDDVIGFKGARIQVINASNSGIKYKVIQNLRRPE